MRACRDCVFMRKGIQGMPNDCGECHLNPPTVVASMHGMTAAWPVVKDTDFCGSFSPSNHSVMGNAPIRPLLRGGMITRPIDPICRPSKEADRVIEERGEDA